MKLFICAVFILLTTPACMFQRHAVLTGPDGMTIKFDTRGNTPFLMQLLMMGATNTNINVGDSDGD